MSTSAIVDRFRTLFEATPPFDRLPQDAKDEVISAMTVDYLEEGEVVIEQGATTNPGLYIVESGMVRLMDVTVQRLLDKCGEGDMFGTFSLLKGGGSIYEAKAIEPTVCAILKSADFRRLYDTYPEFKAFFDNDLRQYVRRMYSDVDVSGRHVLFNRSIGQFSHRRVVNCRAADSAQVVAQLMRSEGSDVVVVMDDDLITGVITSHDLRDRVVGRGMPVETPARRLMKRPVFVSESATLFDAMEAMMDHGVGQVIVSESGDAGGDLVAILRDRDVAHFRAQDPVSSLHRLAMSRTIDELKDVRADTSDQLLNLYRQGANPEMLNRVMSIVYDRLTIRILEIVERQLRRDLPDGDPGLPWLWLRLGSGGRREMSLTSEQHNALVYADPASDAHSERAEQYFNRLADSVNAALETCGFLPSELVARDPRWRLPLRKWKQAYREWILQSNEADLKYAMPFFDLRGLYGDKALLTDLEADVVDALNVQAMDEERAFLPLLAVRAVRHRPPLSFFRRFVLERSGEHKRTLDIRDRGIAPIADAARTLAVELRYFDSTNTFDRLRRAAEEVPDLATVIEAAVDAYRFMVDFRMESQLKAVEAGDKPTNYIDPMNLNKLQQNLLRTAFASAAALQDEIAKRYDLSRRGWLPAIANRAGLPLF